MLKRNPLHLLQQFEIPFHDEGREWVTIECPYHNDAHDRLEDCHGGVNRESGAFTCFSCGAKHNILSVISTKMGVPVMQVEAHVDNILGTQKRGYVDASLVELCHKELLVNQEMLAKLVDRHGITIESVKKYRLGHYPSIGRVTIPIPNKNGEYCDLRQYKYDADNKKIISIKGGKASLYPLDALAEDTVYIAEGEFKAILMRQMGFNAITQTAGANTWRDDWSPAFAGKHVVIVYDVDKAGRKGAGKICIELYPHAKSIKNVFLAAVADISNGDITDYFVKRQLTPEDFKALVDATPYFTAPKDVEPVKLEDNDPIKVKLARSSEASFNGKLVDVTAVVSAKDTSPYILPSKCTVLCNRDKDFCSMCPVTAQATPLTVEIDPNDPVVLELAIASKEKQKELLKRKAGVYHSCKSFEFKQDGSINVEELRLVPQIAIGHASEEQVTRKAFFVGHGLASNNTYQFTARVCAEPGNHHATLLAYKAESVVNDLDTFTLAQDLTVFQPVEWSVEGIEAKLDTIYEDLENNVTRIYQRRDLHLFYDLAWHSALYIPFEGRNIKGWADVLVIGDSGQGKSETSSRLLQHYKCGERVDSKRASIAGIVGGLQETAKRWFITWGTIPLNDRRLVILEEVKGMPAPELAKMTDMRSSGIAELNKIERARTMARVRLVWISNPRSDGKLSSYNYGVDAVRELIGSLEDIRRFDMVMAVSSGDVPIEMINRRHESTVPHNFTSDLCSHLIAWAWSRKEADIKIEAAAEQEIMDAATRMGKVYSSSCPIVEPSDQRLKICRLATALAARTYSVNDQGNLLVRRCHVQVIERFLNNIYRCKSLGYFDYSVSQKGEEAIDAPDEVEAMMRDIPNARDTVRGLIESELIRTEDIMNFTEWPMDRSNEYIGLMIRKGCIRRSRKGGYKKTSAFIEILKKLDRAADLSSNTYREMMQNGDF